MGLIEPGKDLPIRSEIEKAAQSIVHDMNHVVNTCERVCNSVSALATEHTRAALAAVLTAHGEDPAELLSMYNKMRDFVAGIDAARDPGELP